MGRRAATTMRPTCRSGVFPDPHGGGIRRVEPFEWIVDDSPHRSGRWIPAVATPIVPASRLDQEPPDACLINRYQPGARMSLHQDKDETDFGAPIVSVSLGLPAIFLFGGLQRSDKPRRFRLEHGDIAVWGGPARLRFHGVAPLADGEHALLGRQRINLTFRKAR